MMRTALALALVLVACGGDDVPPPTVQDVALDPGNTNGVQFETPTFEVPLGQEVQDCYFFTVPDLNGGQDIWVDHVRIGVNDGSHHVNLFRVKTIVNLDGASGEVVHNGECFKSGNWADWPLVANNQNSTPGTNYFDWQLPENVAYRFSPGEKLMLQVHYVNAATQDTPEMGKAVLDLYRSDLTAPMEMGTLFATQQSIRVCRSNPNVSYHGVCRFPDQPVTIGAANGHFHSRGVKFDIFKWDGSSEVAPPDSDLFYESLTWDDPPMKIYNDVEGMQVAGGSGIWWTCDYQWQEPPAEAGGCAAVDARDPLQAGDCCYTFGPFVETSEHCNVFLYYYPKVNRTDITCF